MPDRKSGRVVAKGCPPLEISLEDIEQLLLHGGYGHYWLTVVFKGGIPPVELRMDEALHARFVRSLAGVGTLTKNVDKDEHIVRENI